MHIYVVHNKYREKYRRVRKVLAGTQIPTEKGMEFKNKGEGERRKMWKYSSKEKFLFIIDRKTSTVDFFVFNNKKKGRVN